MSHFDELLTVVLSFGSIIISAVILITALTFMKNLFYPCIVVSGFLGAGIYGIGKLIYTPRCDD